MIRFVKATKLKITTWDALEKQSDKRTNAIIKEIKETAVRLAFQRQVSKHF